MTENKTKPNLASVADYIAAIEDELRRKDCGILLDLMTKVTQEKAVMWGTGIVGFGSYHYKYASGREGDSCLTGFSSRKGDISVYLVGACPEQDELLAQLGRHKMGKSCLSIRKLSDVDLTILERLISNSVAEMKRLYPS
jgi:hypothetical protein